MEMSRPFTSTRQKFELAAKATRLRCPRRRNRGARIPEEYAVGIPTTPILLLRFPDGDVEYRSTRGELPVGTRVRARGSEWRIARYQGTSAYLEPLDDASGAPGSPLATPLGLGDDPLTLEILSAV